VSLVAATGRQGDGRHPPSTGRRTSIRETAPRSGTIVPPRREPTVPNDHVVPELSHPRVLVRAVLRAVLPLLFLLIPLLPDGPAERAAPPPPSHDVAAPPRSAPDPHRAIPDRAVPDRLRPVMDEEVCAALGAYVALERGPHELTSVGFGEVMDLAAGEDLARVEELRTRNRDRLEVYGPLVDHLWTLEGAAHRTPVELLERALRAFEELELVFAELLAGEAVAPGRLNVALIPTGALDRERPAIVAWAAGNCPDITVPR
jgi:hypothetical protein